ncbi:hypothetical protein DRW03_14545 [Corallococcus sp. H22C18031201]|uniref:hypothetical protein n=1 Tax=Citreicoccus inhibens TaxID=2849499 RepID=UPI000E71EC61|nr:hypothetical protein [Citreicoccus inhibens]MBU8895436.1 hypothetical protein [Citreicoccus inhibens]RJS22528.1 hypothetical protein DRW03_14545 [Corallococcus sp. H22C18031201]
MRTRLYVLGAMLGAAPGLLPVVSSMSVPPSGESRQEARGASRKGKGRSQGSGQTGNHAEVVPPPLAPEARGPDAHGTDASEGAASGSRTRQTGEAKAPRHPCELVTILQVPCDPSRAVCEYTYWECPEAVNPLRV